jgi:hypothetical protein
MNRESKEEQVEELFKLKFEGLCAFLKKTMSNDLDVYFYVITGFWEKLITPLKSFELRGEAVLT